MTNLPVACTLDPATLNTRREGLLREMMRLAEPRETLSDGYRLRFPPSAETLTLIAQAIDAERLCCRFLRFTLIVEPNAGPFLLDLTGPEGTTEFLTALFDE